MEGEGRDQEEVEELKREEVEALKAIFSDELQVDEHHTSFRLSLDSKREGSKGERVLGPLVVTIQVSDSYPSEAASVDVTCLGLSRPQHEQLAGKLRDLARQKARQESLHLFDLFDSAIPYLHDILPLVDQGETGAQAAHCGEWGGDFGDGPQKVEGNGGNDRGAVLEGDWEGEQCKGSQRMEKCLVKLHHMRQEARYGKMIEKWARDLDLGGRLLFQANFIFIVLEGSSSSLSEYLLLHRTQQVDVDSHGRRCKERMLEVLDRSPISSRIYSDFRIERLEKLEQLIDALKELGLDKHVPTFKNK